MSYTDVDRLILNRWTEVVALREAFEALLWRMTETVDGALKPVGRWADENGWQTEMNAKVPSIVIWKPDWAKGRNAPAVDLRVGEFAPLKFGKVNSDHPWLWLMTWDVPGFKFKEDGRVEFARQLRVELGSSAGRWEDHATNESSEPFGRFCSDVANEDRVRWMSQPGELTAFLTKSVEELLTLAPAIDKVLAKFKKV